MADVPSLLQNLRRVWEPKLPKVLAGPVRRIAAAESKAGRNLPGEVRRLFPQSVSFEPLVLKSGSAPKGAFQPLTCGLVFSGGPASGGHNVAAGLFDQLRRFHPKNRLVGYLGGPSGLLKNQKKLIGPKEIEAIRHSGGFHLLGSGRTKLETEEQFEAVAKNLLNAGVSVLVIVGGDDSNTNAALLAEYALRKKFPLRVLGCPKTIDGDLRNEAVEMSFGFDTAVKVYSELAGNIAKDCMSSLKYWHFIRLMGRSASHIALEVALRVQPNVCLISEEVAAKNQTLAEIVEEVARAVVRRAEAGKSYGLVLVPEGLLEFVPEVKALIGELNEHLADPAAPQVEEEKERWVENRLSPASKQAFSTLPPSLRRQLLSDRDPHGNVQVSKIETEKFLMEAVQRRLAEWKKEGKFQGSFSSQGHFFGYEGRCADPSFFDAVYGYALGATAAVLAAFGKTGYLVSIRNLSAPPTAWRPGAVPLVSLIHLERRKGKEKPVIQKALVDLNGGPFRAWAKKRDRLVLEDAFRSPGPRQFWGPKALVEEAPWTLLLEQGKKPKEL